MTNDDIERKAREWATKRCKEIQSRRDLGLEPYLIHDAIVSDFLEGVKAERERVKRFFIIWEGAYADDESGEYRGGYDDCWNNLERQIENPTPEETK